MKSFIRKKIGFALLSFVFINQSCALPSLSSFDSIKKRMVAQYTFVSRLIGAMIARSKNIQKKITLENHSSASKLAKKIFHENSTKNDTTKPFLFGVSTSEHQCSKQCTPEICDWSRFAHEKDLSQPTDERYSCDLWNNYESYIDQLQDLLHINAFRLSVEWPLVQPHETFYDKSSLDHYANFFVYLIKKGITPVVCFHHYTNPCWFIDKDGFENKENNKHFTAFCDKVYKTIIQKLDKELTNGTIDSNTVARLTPLWATFNSPEGYAFKGYRQHEGPPSLPGKESMGWAMHVLENMVENVHPEVYHQLKETYQTLDLKNKNIINEPHIGFLKNVHPLEPHKNIKSTLKYYFTKYVTCLIGNSLQHEYIYRVFANDPKKLKTVDFIGINFYSNGLMEGTKKVAETDEQYKTDNANYRIDPEGLYSAIAEVSKNLAEPAGKLKGKKTIDIIVAENGIATEDTVKRNNFYRNYLTATYEALKADYRVVGHLIWTAFDNYEWPKQKQNNEQSDKRIYGLCSVSKDGKKLTIKEGARYFSDFGEELHNLIFQNHNN